MPKKLNFFDKEATCGSDSGSDSNDDDNEYEKDSFLASEDDVDDLSSECSEAAENNDDVSAESSQHVVVDIPLIKKARGRPSKKARKEEMTEKPPGHSSYPANDFSLTITKQGGDVALNSIDFIYNGFILPMCIKGALAFEVGQRAFNLHIQGLFRVHYPKSKVYVTLLVKLLKSLLPEKGKKYKINLKPFGINQTFLSMIGYVTKDRGKSHFQLRTHNVTLQVIFYYAVCFE